MSKTYKLIFWGPGNIGGTALKAALERPEFEVVGVKVWSPEKDGVDAGELAGGEPIGVKATTDTDELVALDADCVIHTAAQQPDMATLDEDVIRLLESGKNVVSTQSYHFPVMRDSLPEWRNAAPIERLEEACERGGATLHGAGIHPSFMFERLVMTLTGLLTEVEHIRLVETVNALEPSSVFPPLVQQILGFGADPEIINTDFPGAIGTDPYYREVIAFAANRIFGADPHDVRFEHEYKGLPGDGEFKVGELEIKPGTTQVICITHRGYLGDHHFFTNEEHWYAGSENRYFGEQDPPFGQTTSTHDYIIEVKGKPTTIRMQMDLDPTVEGDMPAITHASAVTLLQSVVPVTEAEPGILYHDVSPHAAPDFRQATVHA
jgi:hypothetical protein